MRIPALVLGALLALPLPLQAGGAGCGQVPTLEAAATNAAAVFVGRAGAVSPTSDTVVFDVSWQWKGRPMEELVEVQVAAADDLTSSAASRTFSAGGNYLIFTANAFEPFVVDACSGSVPYGDGSVIPPSLWEPLGNSQPELPLVVATDSGGARPPTFSAMGAAALIAVTLLVIGKFVMSARKRRKERLAAGPEPFKMRRSDKAWLAEQEELENTKPSYGERELEKQRKVWAKKRKKRKKAAEAAAKAAAKERAAADS